MDRADAIAKEITRVREMKRNLIATVEFLRTEMEAGRIHLRVNPDPSFRSVLATQQRSQRKRFYVDPVSGVFSSVKKETWRFVHVSELFDQDGEIKDEIIIEIKP